MTAGPASFYRREALDHRDRPAAPGTALRLAPPWTRWLYWFAVGLLVGAIATASVVRVDRTVSGAAVVDPSGTSFTALLPLSDAAAVPEGRQVRLQVSAAGVTAGTGQLLGVAERSEPITRAAAQQAGLGSIPSPALMVRGTLTVRPSGSPTPTAGIQARATVVVGSQSLMDVFSRGVGRMFGPVGSR